MANITHGMNADEVDKIGHKLQDVYANQITQFITQIESMVNNTANIWVGKDSNDFRSWWPQKRAMMKAIAEDLHGFGQSALNNASEQRGVSGH